MSEPHDELLELARELSSTLNAYEAHTLTGVLDEPRGIHVGPHEDVRRCSDASLHRPWDDVVFGWPGYDRRASARAGRMAGAEVALLSKAGRHVVVRYIATDHRWVVDINAGLEPAAS